MLNLYEPSWQPSAETCFKSLLRLEILRDFSGGKRLDSEAKDICLYMYENKSCTPGWNHPRASKLLTELVCNLSLLKWRWSFQLPCCLWVGGQTLPASPANWLLYFFFSLHTKVTHSSRQTRQISKVNRNKMTFAVNLPCSSYVCMQKRKKNALKKKLWYVKNLFWWLMPYLMQFYFYSTHSIISVKDPCCPRRDLLYLFLNIRWD